MPMPRRPADLYELKRRLGRPGWHVYWMTDYVPHFWSTGTEDRATAERLMRTFIKNRNRARGERQLPPAIREAKAKLLREGIVYFIQCERTGAIKVGLATNPRNRLTTLQTGSTSRLVLLATMPGGRKLEEELHAAFAAERVYGEWFNPCAELMALIAGVLERKAA